jgi:hypothetical protein
VPFVENIYQAYNNAQSHLVAYKDSTGKIETAIMVIRPADGDVSKIPTNTTLKNFTGDIMLYTLNETFIRGHALVNGLIKGEIKTEETKEIANLQQLNKPSKTMATIGAGNPNKIQAYEERCEWRQGPSYVNAEGEVVIVARRFCAWHYVQDQPYIPEQTTIDYIEQLPTYGGEIITDEIARKIIATDTSITNNPKIKCLLEKLLGLDGTNGNPQMKGLLEGFINKGFDVTFKIGTTDTASKAETSPGPNDPTKYYITLNRNKINTLTQMSWVKVLLHEAFHASLMQKSYEMFGNYAVGLWAVGPKDLTLQELMDKIESLVQPQPTLAQQHHEFMAMNIAIIKDGLKSFYDSNNTATNYFTDHYFLSLAYEGLHETNYYKEKVIKNPDGSEKIVDFVGTPTPLNTICKNLYKVVERDTTIPCN